MRKRWGKFHPSGGRSDRGKAVVKGIIQVEHVDPATLKPHPRNYHTHPPGQLEHIRASLRDSGHYRNVVVSSDGYILAGHGVVEATLLEELPTVPIYLVPHTHDSPEAIRIVVGDNEMARLAMSSDVELAKLLEELSEIGPGELLGTGFDEASLAELGAFISRPDEGVEADEVTSPGDFPEVDENISTEHTCPKCGYRWSGGK